MPAGHLLPAEDDVPLPLEEEKYCISEGEWPAKILRRVLDHVPLAELGTLAQVNRAWHSAVRDDALWKRRWELLAWKSVECVRDPLLDAPVAPPPPPPAAAPKPASTELDLLADLEWDVPATSSAAVTEDRPYYARLRRAYQKLRPYLSDEAPAMPSVLADQGALMGVLIRFVSPGVYGVPGPGLEDTKATTAHVQRALGLLETQLRSTYSAADARRQEAKAKDEAETMATAEAEMQSLAAIAWELRACPPALASPVRAPPALPLARRVYEQGGSAIAALHVSSRPILTARLPFNPRDAMRASTVSSVDTASLHAFFEHVHRVLDQEAHLALRIFPKDQAVVPMLLEAVVDGPVNDYVSTLLQQAREISRDMYLEAFGHTVQAARVLVSLPSLEPVEAADIVYSASAPWDGEYFELEQAWCTRRLQRICDRWLRDLNFMLAGAPDPLEMLAAQTTAAQKRSLLSKFRDALSAPVASRSESASDARGSPRISSEVAGSNAEGGYRGLTEAPASADDDDDDGAQPTTLHVPMRMSASAASLGRSPARTPQPMSSLLSLETAMESITVARISLQRLDRVRDSTAALEARARTTSVHVVVELFASLNDRHLSPGFAAAREQISSYNPTTSGQAQSQDAADHITPLLLFFELVHIGDTIQQMIQAFVDQLSTAAIGKMDFTNPVVREKKRFEGDLDEHVAAGLSAGVALLVQQIEHIVLTHQHPRDFYPEAGAVLDVAEPTHACKECCATLRTYCDLLATCADKALLDVFYQEIGFRLYSYV